MTFPRAASLIVAGMLVLWVAFFALPKVRQERKRVKTATDTLRLERLTPDSLIHSCGKPDLDSSGSGGWRMIEYPGRVKFEFTGFPESSGRTKWVLTEARGVDVKADPSHLFSTMPCLQKATAAP